MKRFLRSIIPKPIYLFVRPFYFRVFGRSYMFGESSVSKPRRLRQGFFEKYCKGYGIDIGYGGDLLSPNCRGWDFEHGDAQYLRGIKDNSFDFVYSSHTLEHMKDQAVSLKNWWRVLKPGGYLILYLPHRDLYEKKKTLPSKWNLDHKCFFLIDRDEEPDTIGIVPLIKRTLSDFKIIYAKECSRGHTITDPNIHSDEEYSIEVVVLKRPKFIDSGLYEKAIFEMRKKPKYADLIKWGYFDEDVVKAASRFSKSYEAGQIIWTIDKLLSVKNNRERCNFRIADIGGGRGIVSYALTSAGYQVCLFDIDKSNVCGTGAARELFEKTKMDIKIIRTDIEHYEKKDEQYDLVFCRQVLHHAKDLNCMVIMMTNLLKPGGWLYAFKEHVIRTDKDLPVFLKNHPAEEFNTYENAFTRSVYLNAFRKTGLKDIQHWIAGYTSASKEFHSVIDGEDVPAHIPPKKFTFLLKRIVRSYLPSPGTEFSFIGRKKLVKNQNLK